jgi:hypothetical protein
MHDLAREEAKKKKKNGRIRIHDVLLLISLCVFMFSVFVWCCL